MQYIKRPVTRILDGDEAINALRSYVQELEVTENNPELTERQRAALARIAGALVSSLEAKQHIEVQAQTLESVAEQMKKLKNTILGIFQETEQEEAHRNPTTPKSQQYSQLQTSLNR